MKYSGKRIARAGESLRDFRNLSGRSFEETMDVISFWRQTHEEPVRKALNCLTLIVSKLDSSALYARRMKRVTSIYGKLTRYPKMSLYKMNDIGGCRVILKDITTLYKVLNQLKKLSEFKVTNELTPKVNDYIKSPKTDGYRSVHVIGKFLDENNKERFIEVQLRTPIQHSWATAVEIVDLFTKQSLKTNQGNPEWASLFEKLGSFFADMDTIKGFVKFNPDAQYKFYSKKLQQLYGKKNLVDGNSLAYKKFKSCYECLNNLNVVELFNGFANSLNIIDKEFEFDNYEGYVLIICSLAETKTSARVFDNADEAEKAYMNEEVKHSSDDSTIVAMVSTPNISELRLAYPNYFADSTAFLKCVLRITEFFEDMQRSYFATVRLN